MTKTASIERILITTKVDPEKYFDYLADQSDEYISKLLKVILLLNAIQNKT